ncbi:MAG: hypothetical protein ABIQ95_00025 [Bdellovibrionia bacterium]
MSCDGDTIAMTAGTNPSIEDILQGNVPKIPVVRLHNPLLAYEFGRDFMMSYFPAFSGS